MGLDVRGRESFPFEHYSLIESEYSSDLQSAVSKEIAQHQFTFSEQSDHPRSKITCVRLKNTVLFGVGFGAAVHASTAPTNALQVVVPIIGQLVSHDGDNRYRARPGEGLLLSPNAPVDLDWSADCTAVVAWVARDVLCDLATKYLGSSLDMTTFSFPPQIALSEGIGLSIANSLGVIVSELDSEETLFSRGITSSNIESCLLTSLLYSSGQLKSALESATLGGKSSLKLALEYIEAHISEDITACDLVEATGTSLRKLQYDFSRELGMGPMSKVRQEKLIRARTNLQESEPGNTTVADIAAKWGFYDRRYFSKVYRSEFGELPSQTLSRPHFRV
tara:strand:+ start:125576 stop:126580 length:1005 start_codon:yes stop_codon:yes gene_type:complete